MLKREKQTAQACLFLCRQFRLGEPSSHQRARLLHPFRTILQNPQRGLTQVSIRRGEARNDLFRRQSPTRTRRLIEQEQRRLLHTRRLVLQRGLERRCPGDAMYRVNQRMFLKPIRPAGQRIPQRGQRTGVTTPSQRLRGGASYRGIF